MYLNSGQPSGLGCASCSTPMGMGSLDLSTMGPEEWFIIGVLGALVYSTTIGAEPKRRRRRSKKRSAGFAAGSAVLAIAVVGGISYLAYSSLAQGGGGS